MVVARFEENLRKATMATLTAGILMEHSVETINSLNWERILSELDAQGNALLKGILPAEECRLLAELYLKDELFRSRVVMARHGFGRGEYKYFKYPLPDMVAELRTAIYAQLAPLANHWNSVLKSDVRSPEKHGDYLRRCHDA